MRACIVSDRETSVRLKDRFGEDSEVVWGERTLSNVDEKGASLNSRSDGWV